MSGRRSESNAGNTTFGCSRGRVRPFARAAAALPAKAVDHSSINAGEAVHDQWCERMQASLPHRESSVGSSDRRDDAYSSRRYTRRWAQRSVDLARVDNVRRGSPAASAGRLSENSSTLDRGTRCSTTTCGADDDVRQVVGTAARLERLVAECVEDRPAHRSVAERPQQGSLVDEAAAGDVDQPRAGLPSPPASRRRSCSPCRGVSGRPGRRNGLREEGGRFRARRRDRASPRRTGALRHWRRDPAGCGLGTPTCRVTRHRTRSQAPRLPGRSSRARRCRRSVAQLATFERAAMSARAGAPGPGSYDGRQDIIITYSAIGRENTPRAFVMTISALARGGVQARSTPEEAEWTRRERGPARAGDRRRRPTAGVPAPRVVERVIGQALDRQRDDTGPGPRRAYTLEVAGAVAGRQDRRQGDGRRHATGALPGPAVRAGSAGYPGLIADAHLAEPGITRAIHFAGSSIRRARQRLGSLPQPARARGPPASA